MTLSTSDITAVILAGGQGRRLGGQDKGLLDYQGKRLIDRILEFIVPQVSEVIINANRNLATYTTLGYTVISDEMSDFQGPLAGFSTAMHAAKTDYIVTMPCDGPTLAEDYVKRLVACYNDAKTHNDTIVVAHDGERLQPVHALIPISLSNNLLRFLESGERKIDRWYTQHTLLTVDFSDIPQMFFNINTEEQRQVGEYKQGRDTSK